MLRDCLPSVRNFIGEPPKTQGFERFPIFFSDAILGSSSRIVSIFPRGGKKKPDAFTLQRARRGVAVNHKSRYNTPYDFSVKRID